jgi:hypothetical protein
VRSGVVTSILILAHLALGFVTILLAVDEDVAEGNVRFAGDGWRIALGLAGVFLAYRAGRALVRTINGTAIELSPDVLRRARLNGTLLLLLGAAFLAASWSRSLGGGSVAFYSWARTVYVWGGWFVLLTGLLQFARPATTPRSGAEPMSFPDPTSVPAGRD